MKYSEFLKALQNRSVPPVMTFLGEESFLKDRAMEALITRFLDADSRQYNYRSFAGEELKDNSFLEDASTLPMFSDWKVVHIKGASALDKTFDKIAAKKPGTPNPFVDKSLVDRYNTILYECAQAKLARQGS